MKTSNKLLILYSVAALCSIVWIVVFGNLMIMPAMSPIVVLIGGGLALYTWFNITGGYLAMIIDILWFRWLDWALEILNMRAYV